MWMLYSVNSVNGVNEELLMNLEEGNEVGLRRGLELRLQSGRELLRLDLCVLNKQS